MGEVVCLLGENGAGKTTLMQILTGVINKDSGEITFQGEEIDNKIEKIRQRIGVCPQYDILWDELSVIEHLELYGKLRGLSKENSRKRDIELLKRVQLDEEMDRVVSELSGGMKRRLSMSISGMHKP